MRNDFAPDHPTNRRLRRADGKLAPGVISEDLRAAVIRQYVDDKISVGRIKTEHSIGMKTIYAILADAGIQLRTRSESQAISQKSRTGRRTQATAQNKARKRRAGLTGGGLRAAVDQGPPVDADAKLLMRFFVPVCRAKTVDPKAPDNVWIVGRQRVPEAKMRQMAEARR